MHHLWLYFNRKFAVRVCSGCSLPISSEELVMRARDHVYHVQCFSCVTCNTVLHTGEHFGMHDHLIYCEHHYDAEAVMSPLPHHPGDFPVTSSSTNTGDFLMTSSSPPPPFQGDFPRNHHHLGQVHHYPPQPFPVITTTTTRSTTKGRPRKKKNHHHGSGGQRLHLHDPHDPFAGLSKCKNMILSVAYISKPISLL